MTVYLTGDYATEYDDSTKQLLHTLAQAGIADEQIMFVRDHIMLEFIEGKFRQSHNEVDQMANIIPVLDLVFIGLLVREFIPRENGMYGYREADDPTDAALRGAITTARDNGASEEDIQMDARDVFRMLKMAAPEGWGDSMDGETLVILLIGMILHRRIPVERAV